jgi:ElaB/YqjD/DUF883 family membrane-anchored ribosome-binding protein
MSHGFPGWSSVEDDIEARLHRLGKEVAALRRAVGRSGGRTAEHARETAGDLAAELSERLSDLMPRMRRRGAAAERVAREHPAAVAVAGVVVVGLALSLLLHRRRG